MTVLYYHKRKDTNEVFYVGIGNINRPYEKTSRNEFWWNIVNKVGYNVEIVHFNLDWGNACQLETKYIKKFGRRDLGLGNLVNLTDGGEGNYGWSPSEETKLKMSLSQIGEKNHNFGKETPDEVKQQISKSLLGVKKSKSHVASIIKGVNRKLTSENIIEATELYVTGKLNYNELAKKYNVSRTTISRAIKGESWSHLQRDKKVVKGEGVKLTKNDVVNIRKEYKEGKTTQKSIAEKYGVKQSTISNVVNGVTFKNIT